MADGLSMTEAMQSYKAAVEAPQWQQESKDTASILSTQAETHRKVLADAKEQAQQRLSYLAGKKEVGMENPTLSPANLGQAIQLQDSLINKYKQQPELQQYAIKEKEGLLKQQEEALKLEGLNREQKRAELYDVLSEATTSPDAAMKLATSDDPRLQHFGQLLSSQKPVLFGGRQVLFKDLDLPAQKEVVSRILSPVAPKIDQGMLSRQSRLELDYQKLQEEMEAKLAGIRAKEQDTAAKRDKVATGKEKVESQTTIAVAKLGERKEKDVSTIEKQQMALLTAAGLASPTDTKEVLGYKYKELSDTDKATFDKLEEQKKRRVSQYEEDKAKLEAVHGGAPIPKKQETSAYSSAQDVKAAYQAGKISRDEAKKHLEKFGYK